ncbi:hypothetical protein DVH05_027252 [Phytophthora capsici]|nr:hypothetical protein DVH05_027252 [Phytophthora capsici]
MENITVCIRVRPLNEREMRSNDQPALTCPTLNMISITDPETGTLLTGDEDTFEYDEVFDASSNSHVIYERVTKRVVRSTLTGINGTVFTYRQTSTGKTFTMQGDGVMPFEPGAENAKSGILQLALEDIFQYIEHSADRDFLLHISFLEIYNEVVKGLLDPENGANLKLREDSKNLAYAECKEVVINNQEDIVTLLRKGNWKRKIRRTEMNNKSSRSHSIFKIKITCKQKAGSRRSETELVSSLNLVDLAGS